MQRIKTDIKCNTFKNAYLLFGEETYLIDYYAKQIINAVVDEDTRDFNLLSVSSEIPEETEADGFVNSYPFMAEKKVLYIRNSGLFKKSNDAQKKFWTSFLETLPDYVIIIFAEDETDKRNAVYKLIDKKYLAVEFSFQKPSELTSWTGRVLGSMKKKITPKDAAYIVELCGPSMQNIKSELEKLSLFITDREEITTADIEQIVTKNIENRVFDMVDDIAEGKNRDALKKLSDLKALNEEPIKIISIIFNKYSQYKKLSLLKGRPLAEICRLCGLYEKYAKNYLRQLNSLPIEKINSVLDICTRMDFDIKSGKIDKWLALELIMAEAMK